MTKPFAVTLDVRSSLANHTGMWRSERPVYTAGLPPCEDGCPAAERVQSWLYAAEDGGYQAAWRRLVEDNPFPAVMGRVCYHPCETACNRAQLDTAVGINSVERFLGDHAIEQGWQLPGPAADTGKRVLVIGAGPCGLSAAYQLRRLGHAVAVHDAGAQAGGMMRHGIPTFRLPRDILDIEIARLAATGIEFHLESRVDDVLAARDVGGFDAVLVAIGAQLSRRAYLPAAQTSRVLDALGLLGRVADGERPELGRVVVVYGGGNTAMDAARTARRLGADDAIIVYRRTRAQAPAEAEEIDEALAEGVQIRWLRTIATVGDGTLTLEKMRLDAAGMPQPTGEFEELGGDAVVLALGQEVDRSLLDTVPGLRITDGVVEVDEQLMTGFPGVFAGGDAAPTVRSVTHAIGQGRRAAAGIDAWLRGAAAGPGDTRAPVPFPALNTWYYADAPHAVRPRLEVARRLDGFGEVVGGLAADTALYEARRCLSCGNCFGCDNCFGVCPDNAVIKLLEGPADPYGSAGRYAIDLDYCKGCGLCAAECPCGAIEMQAERT